MRMLAEEPSMPRQDAADFARSFGAAEVGRQWDEIYQRVLEGS
jgi:hypothetical protein